MILCFLKNESFLRFSKSWLGSSPMSSAIQDRRQKRKREIHPMQQPLRSFTDCQRQRLAICQAIMAKKKFLIFDEPTSGLDFRHMCQVTERLKQLAQHGYILFVVTHDSEKWKNSDFERSNLLSDLQSSQQLSTSVCVRISLACIISARERLAFADVMPLYFLPVSNVEPRSITSQRIYDASSGAALQ